MSNILFMIDKKHVDFLELAFQELKKHGYDPKDYYITFSEVEEINPKGNAQKYYQIWFYPFSLSEDWMTQKRGRNFIIKIDTLKKNIQFQAYRD